MSDAKRFEDIKRRMREGVAELEKLMKQLHCPMHHHPDYVPVPGTSCADCGYEFK